jgi:hypothetical protein
MAAPHTMGAMGNTGNAHHNWNAKPSKHGAWVSPNSMVPTLQLCSEQWVPKQKVTSLTFKPTVTKHTIDSTTALHYYCSAFKSSSTHKPRIRESLALSSTAQVNDSRAFSLGTTTEMRMPKEFYVGSSAVRKPAGV